MQRRHFKCHNSNYSHFAIFNNQCHKLRWSIYIYIYIYMLQRSEKKLNFALPREEINLWHWLLKLAKWLHVELWPLKWLLCIEFKNTEHFMILYICSETHVLYIAYIDKRFAFLCSISFYEMCIPLKVFLNTNVTPHSQPTSYMFKLYNVCNTSTHNSHKYIGFQVLNIRKVFSFSAWDPLLQFWLYPQDTPHQ